MIRDIVWNELNQTKFNEFYISLLLDKKKAFKNYYLIFTLIFSTGGVLSWKVWENAPLAACALLALVQIFNLIQSKVVLGDNELNDLSLLRSNCIAKFNELEKLWVESFMPENNEQSKDAIEEFYTIRKTYLSIVSLEDKLTIYSNGSVYKKADEKARAYFEYFHRTKAKL